MSNFKWTNEMDNTLSLRYPGEGPIPLSQEWADLFGGDIRAKRCIRSRARHLGVRIGVEAASKGLKKCKAALAGGIVR